MYYSTIVVLFCVSKCPITTRPCIANALFLGTHRVSFYINEDNQMISDSKHKIKPFQIEYSWKFMELNLPMEAGSEQATSSDDGQSQFTAAFRKMMKKEVEMMVIRMMKKEVEMLVIHTVKQVIEPIIGDLLRKIVKDEIQSAQAKFSTGGNRSLENETMVSKERSLGLKFLDEVSPSVLTGKVINGKEGTPLSVALVDKITGQIIDCGPESSSKVEILVLEANDDDNDWSPENFNNRIIREGDKNKPHFAKSNYIYLKDGIGTLCENKLGHDKRWMKNCKCRLGARMESFGGKKVQEAWTESFIVSDSRSQLYKKSDHPSLSDPVWRLKKIGKDGQPFQRLKKEKILTVRDFLFLYYTNPEALQQIVGAGAKIWNATIEHAQTCVIDDQRMYVYYPMSESNTGVVFDVVGQLKGAIHGSHYVLNSNLSEAEQDCVHKLLLSAFEYRNNTIPFDNENAFQNQNNIITFDDEDGLLQKFPHVSAPVNFITLEGSNDCDLSIFETNIEYDHSEPGTSSQIVQSHIQPSGHPNNISHFGLVDMGQSYDPGLCVPNRSPSWPYSDIDHLLENFGDYDSIRSLIFPEGNNISETLMVDSNSRQQNNACSIQLGGAVSLMLRVVRAKKRFMALRGIHVHKRQRT